MSRFAIALLMLTAACVDEPDTMTSRFPALTLASPLELSEIDRGVGVQSGEAMALAKYNPTSFPKLVDALPHAVYTIPAYDASTQELGEFVTFPPPQGVDARGPVVFKSTSVNSGRSVARAGGAFGGAGRRQSGV